MKLLLLTLASWMSLALCDEAPYPPSRRPDGPRLLFPEKNTQPDTSYQQPPERSQPSDKSGEPNLTVQGLPPRTAPAAFRTVAQLRYPGQTQSQYPQEVQQRNNQQLVRTDFEAQRANFEVARGSQGLPVQQDPTTLFVVTPLNGQQYSGASFNADLRSLEQQLREQETQRQDFANVDGYQRSNNNPDEYNIQLKFGQSPRTEAENNDFDEDTNDFETKTTTERVTAKPNSKDNKNTSKSGTSVETEKSQNYELSESDLPAGYANQLTLLALQQQLAQLQPQAVFPQQYGQLQQVVPSAQFGQFQEQNQAFQQQIGQLQLPIIYQPFTPAQRLTQQPISGQIRNFDPVNFSTLQQLILSNTRQNLEAKATDDDYNNDSEKETGLNKTKGVNPRARDSGAFEAKQRQAQNQPSFSSQTNFQRVQDSQSRYNVPQGSDSDGDVNDEPVVSGLGEGVSSNSFNRYGAPQNKDLKQRTVDENLETATERKRQSSKLRSRRIRPLYTVDESGLIVQLQ